MHIPFEFSILFAMSSKAKTIFYIYLQTEFRKYVISSTDESRQMSTVSVPTSGVIQALN